MTDRPTRRLDAAPNEPESCPKCGAARIWARPYGYGYAEVWLWPWDHEEPDLFDRRKHMSPLAALTCPACGYAELYAQEPEKLLE